MIILPRVAASRLPNIEVLSLFLFFIYIYKFICCKWTKPVQLYLFSVYEIIMKTNILTRVLFLLFLHKSNIENEYLFALQNETIYRKGSL